SAPHFRPEERVVAPAFGLINVEIGRHDIEIADQRHRYLEIEQLLPVCPKTFEPAELVVEFWAGRRIAVREIKTADDHAVDGRFDIAAVIVAWFSRKAAARFNRVGIPCENCHAVPAFLAMPDGAIARLLDGRPRKLL